MLWLDIETGGLDPHHDPILEIGFINTDENLVEIARKAWVLPFHGEVSPFIRDMHGKSGLLAECAATYETHPAPMQASFMVGQMQDWLRENLAPGEKPPLCGSSVHFDRSFLAASPTFASLLKMVHYRNIDVSTVKELARRWAPGVYDSRPQTGAKHRALSDLDDTIAELKHYRKAFFSDYPFSRL